MPVPLLNNVATQDAYVDALTVQFARPRHAFSCNTFNNAIMYQLGYIADERPTTLDVQWETMEHQLVPSLSNFRDTTTEGLPPHTMFAGIRIRSAAVGVPARVTVA